MIKSCDLAQHADALNFMSCDSSSGESRRSQPFVACCGWSQLVSKIRSKHVAGSSHCAYPEARITRVGDGEMQG